MGNNRKKLGFTLAEILITLGIIGVVASITIPPLVNESQDKIVVNQLKKDFTILSQAFDEIKSEEGDLQDWCPYSQYPTRQLWTVCAGDLFAKHLKVSKNCGNGTGVDCIPSIGYLQMDNSSYQTAFNQDIFVKMVLVDGSTLIISAQADSNRGGIFQLNPYVDVNGLKGPNKYGYDFFSFTVLSPNNSPGMVGPAYPRVIVPGGGNRTGTLASTGCDRTVAWQAWGCSAWAIYNENLDYKYVDDLNWDTKTHK